MTYIQYIDIFKNVIKILAIVIPNFSFTSVMLNMKLSSRVKAFFLNDFSLHKSLLKACLQRYFKVLGRGGAQRAT